ncbi:MAG: glycosyltransferase family 39 protein [Elusimicrobia bacterium]|nr:glycosyltransferase family 39 protein [Elusimicrobiota bacterium]
MPPLALIVLGLVMFFPCDHAIDQDMGFYINSALNLFAGKGYTSMDGSSITIRAPLFPWMMAGSFWLLGVSVWSAFWVVRVFCILGPLAVYWLGERFVGKWVGFLAALLILSSYSMNFWSYTHLDAIWPVFVLLFVGLVHRALDTQKPPVFALAGLALALGYWTKEASILFLPLPFCLIALDKGLRNRRVVIGLCILVACFLLAISLWVFPLLFSGHDLYTALVAEKGASMLNAGIVMSPLALVKGYMVGLLDYYWGGSDNSQSLRANFVVAPLFLVAWLFCGLKAIQNDRLGRSLGVGLLLLSPYMAYVGHNNLRVGHLIILLLLSYLALAWFLIETTEGMLNLMKKRLKMPGWLKPVMTASLTSALIVVQVFGAGEKDKGSLLVMRESLISRTLAGKDNTLRMVNLYNERDREVGEWIRLNIPQGSSLMISSPGDRPIYFYAHAKYRVISMPMPFFTFYNTAQSTAINGRAKGPVVFLTAWSPLNDPRNWISALPEEVLHAAIKKYGVDYIITDAWLNFLTLYFDQNAGFKKIKEFDKGAIKIYRVLELRSSSKFEPLVVDRLIHYLRELYKSEPMKLSLYVKYFFEPYLGWNADRVRKLAGIALDGSSRGYRVVACGKIY